MLSLSLILCKESKMKICRLESIKAIDKVYDTSGSRPVRVLCNDYKEYVCKYPEGFPAKKLFYEYICISFARLWELYCPEFCFVRINKEHIPDSVLRSIKRPLYDQLCFGSQVVPDTEDLNNRTASLSSVNSYNFLKIALFDIWVANEDRHNGNYNLLCRAVDKRIELYVIDHSNCFNTGSLERDIYLINDSDSILSSDAALKIFRNKQELKLMLANVSENFENCVKICECQLDNILTAVPPEWGNLQNLYPRLRPLFTENWQRQTIEAFKQYIQIQLF